MLYVILTYDYELFFSKAYFDEDTVLFNTTDRIIEMLSQNNTPATFFIDTCMIKRFKSMNCLNLEEKVSNQVSKMLDFGMEVGMHMHYIWETARNEFGEWIFEPELYMPDKHSDEVLSENIRFGVDYLNEIASNKGCENCISFRAGGFVFEPKALLFDELYKRGIRIDSSVCRYMFKFADNHSFDYSNVPNKDLWQVTNGHVDRASITSESTPYILEIPITAIKEIPLKWIVNRVYPKVESLNKGTHSLSIYKNKKTRIKEAVLSKVRGACFLNSDFSDYRSSMLIIEKYIQKHHDTCEDRYVVMIGHPKFQSENNYTNTESFINQMKLNYECEFITLRDVYKHNCR